MSSGLYGIRRAIRDLLLMDGLWEADEVIIKRRTKIWNDIAVATAASSRGQCLVIGTARGRKANNSQDGSDQVRMELTIPVSLFELPNVSDQQPEAGEDDEDVRWEATVMRLNGDPLGRSPLHYHLEFEDFEDVEDEEYVIRQTIFKTNLLLKP